MIKKDAMGFLNLMWPKTLPSLSKYPHLENVIADIMIAFAKRELLLQQHRQQQEKDEP
jgi:hypothetical protein